MFENYFYGMESDNDDIELDPKVTTNDETAVDDGEAGSDMETVDVTPSNSECEHNEVASAGGIATGDNQEDLEMDPVAATEAYMFKKFHMSSEEAEDLVQEITEAASDLPPVQVGEPEEEVDPDVAAGIVIMPTEDDAGDEPIEDSVVSPDESVESGGGFLRGVNTGALIANGALGASAIWGTIYNAAASIGDFDSGDEMMKSSALRSFVLRIKKMYNRFPSLTEVKDNPKAKTKTGFLSWFLAADVSGENISDLVDTSNLKLAMVENVPVAITTMRPFTGTRDLRQLSGKRVLIATAFVKKSNVLKSIPLCRGTLNSGKVVDASKESYVDPLDDAIFANLF